MRTWIDALADEVRGLENRREAQREWVRGLLPTLKSKFEDNEPYTLSQIASALADAGLTPRRGGKWHRNQVQRLLNIGDESEIEPVQLRRLLEAAHKVSIERPDLPHTERLVKVAAMALVRHRAGVADAAALQAAVRAAVGRLKPID